MIKNDNNIQVLYEIPNNSLPITTHNNDNKKHKMEHWIILIQNMSVNNLDPISLDTLENRRRTIIPTIRKSKNEKTVNAEQDHKIPSVKRHKDNNGNVHEPNNNHHNDNPNEHKTALRLRNRKPKLREGKNYPTQKQADNRRKKYKGITVRDTGKGKKPKTK